MKTKIAASLVFVGVAVLVAVAAYLTQLAPSAPGDSDPGAVVYSGRLDSYLAVAPGRFARRSDRKHLRLPV